MASGDPMVLSTLVDAGGSLLLNSNLEDWADTADAADNWNWNETQVATLSRESGTRTSGAGTYIQRVSIAAPAQSIIGTYNQTVTLLGHEGLPASGYDGQVCYGSVWAKDTGAGTSKLKLELAEYDSDDNLLAAYSDDAVELTSSWAQISYSFTITDDDTAKILFQLALASHAAGSAVIDIDDALLYFTYTFAANPSMPDGQIMSVPMRQFRRTLGGRLIRSRPAGPVAKIEKQLSFRLIGQTQYDALRALWLLDQPMTWTPNHPHLPSTLQVRWVNDFDFHSIGPFSSGPLYAGTMVLSEI